MGNSVVLHVPAASIRNALVVLDWHALMVETEVWALAQGTPLAMRTPDTSAIINREPAERLVFDIHDVPPYLDFGFLHDTPGTVQDSEHFARCAGVVRFEVPAATSALSSFYRSSQSCAVTTRSGGKHEALFTITLAALL